MRSTPKPPPRPLAPMPRDLTVRVGARVVTLRIEVDDDGVRVTRKVAPCSK